MCMTRLLLMRKPNQHLGSSIRLAYQVDLTIEPQTPTMPHSYIHVCFLWVSLYGRIQPHHFQGSMSLIVSVPTQGWGGRGLMCHKATPEELAASRKAASCGATAKAKAKPETSRRSASAKAAPKPAPKPKQRAASKPKEKEVDPKKPPAKSQPPKRLRNAKDTPDASSPGEIARLSKAHGCWVAGGGVRISYVVVDCENLHHHHEMEFGKPSLQPGNQSSLVLMQVIHTCTHASITFGQEW